jgi:CRP/FNR family transcriptional regulator, nitrogen fixation regulation protein
MPRPSHHSPSGYRAQGISTDELRVCAIVGRYEQGQPIGERHDPTAYWYLVVSGAARLFAVQPDGRRQIIDLLLPGDFFGLAASDGEAFGAEAIVAETTLLSFRWPRLERLADSNPQVAHRVLEGAFDTVARLQRQLLVLGRVTACEKVGSFLLELRERLSPQPSGDVVLPVSRYDIADYLAISVETVSRSITDLQHRGAIRLEGARQVKIVDRAALDCRTNGFRTGS